MVEITLVKLDDITLTADMFGMTCAALVVTDFLRLAVKPFVLADVRRHLVVAFQAQHRLRTLVKTQVAAVAFFFVTGMPFDDLAGHDKGLGRPCAERQRQAQQQQPSHQIELEKQIPSLSFLRHRSR